MRYRNTSNNLGGLLRADLVRHVEVRSERARGAGFRSIYWLTLLSPRFLPVLLVRLAGASNRGPLKVISKIFSSVNFFAFGIEISPLCKIGPGLVLPHTRGTVIGAWKIGSDATIFQCVTIGAKTLDFEYQEHLRPTLGNSVTVGAGAKIIGHLVVGDGATVGANSVVLKNVPAGATAVGVPAHYR